MVEEGNTEVDNKVQNVVEFNPKKQRASIGKGGKKCDLNQQSDREPLTNHCWFTS